MIFETPQVGKIETKLITEIDDLKAKMRFRLHEPRRWTRSLRRLSFARAIQGSNSIEGYVAHIDDAAAIVDGDAPTDASADTANALAGYRDDDVRARARGRS